MDQDIGPVALQRSSSQFSNASGKSSRSQTVRARPRKYASYMSSSASSISDKSLTSFPSFSPESPRDERPMIPRSVDGPVEERKQSNAAPSIVESLTASSPQRNRMALFEDAPLSLQHVPGAIHNSSDEHIERLIARNGAISLIRQVAEDLAQRDAQISALRRKTEERERALRKIVLECGLSNLDLETRLRAIEGERKPINDLAQSASKESGLEDLMNEAMNEESILGELELGDNDATVQAADKLKSREDRAVSKGWKDFLWGTTSKKTSRTSSINGDYANGTEPATTRLVGAANRKSVLQNGVFQPPTRSASHSLSQQLNGETVRERKQSSGLATMAMKLVAGTSITVKDGDVSRGRANSTGATQTDRGQSTASAKTNASARTVPAKSVSKQIPAARRPIANRNVMIRGQPDRWDTMGSSPTDIRSTTSEPENYGPVEMDQILPPDAQPPTLTYIYNNTYNSEFLTDRFGFIYDQRRKKRQREAAEQMRKNKRGSRGSRIEMLSGARSDMAPSESDMDASMYGDDDRPDTPLSIEEKGESGKRWQDYLKIATFPTELLSHTPSGNIPAFEVMEGGEVPQSPGITTEERGFLPSVSTIAAQPALTVSSDMATISKPTNPTPPSELAQEDTEPVKLLLKQLGEVHDSLQRDKTVRWNDFLRKVRAERKRDGEAAAAALAATTDSKAQRAMAIMPEATLTDGEMIGVAGLGNKGKVGRAKWNEFKALVLGGIPVVYRAKIWAECSGAAAMKIPGYYDDLVTQPPVDDDPAIVAQIQMDINRTLTDNIFFRKGPGVAKLSEVLLAYSRRNAEVGYCQGMNLITACLLLILPTAEDTFWVLTSIIETILPRGYYDHNLLASRADQQVLRQYVSEILPKLSAHLDDLSIELEALTFQWFLSVFTDCLSAEALFRVWDVVFCTNDGSTFLFQVALALLKLNEQQLLGCGTPAGVYTYINHQMTNHAISIDGLIHASEGLRKVVKREEVENRRSKAIEAEKSLIKQRETRNALRRAERTAAAAAAVEVTEPVATNEEPSPQEVESFEPGSVERPTTALKLSDEDSNANRSKQLQLGADNDGELTVRTPRPVDEERELGIGR